MRVHKYKYICTRVKYTCSQKQTTIVLFHRSQLPNRMITVIDILIYVLSYISQTR